ncbi:MAG: BON domain-containing protein [Mycobacterium sp.]
MRRWLIGAALVGVLLGMIGCGLREGLSEDFRDGAEAAAGPAAPLSVIRRGNEFTLIGDVPDQSAKRALLDAVVTSADDVTVVDGLRVVPSATTPDFAAAAPVFEAAAVIGDFTLSVSGETVTLGGTAAKAAEAATVEEAAQDAWPRADIVNELVASLPGRVKSTEIN